MRPAPDGTHLAFTNSWSVSACATDNYYQVVGADGSLAYDVRSPSLSTRLQPGREFYLIGYSYAWHPNSMALAITSAVRDCTDPATIVVIGGPQLALVQLDDARTESTLISGEFYLLSFDPSGNYLATARVLGAETQIEVYAMHNGQLRLNLGPGFAPTFAPVSQP